MKRPALYCFDIDGTLAGGDAGRRSFDDSETMTQELLDMRPYPNVLQLATQAIEAPNVEVMFCTGRVKRAYGVTWRWLNRHLSLSDADKRVTLVCRPDNIGLDGISQYKLGELVQAIRRQPEKLAELRCYDDWIGNLRLFETLRPMVSLLRLYRVEEGVVTLWNQ
jgi:hypothetical protein